MMRDASLAVLEANPPPVPVPFVALAPEHEEVENLAVIIEHELHLYLRRVQAGVQRHRGRMTGSAGDVLANRSVEAPWQLNRQGGRR